MDSRRSPTLRLLVGLAITLSSVAIYSTYTILQLRSLRHLQTETIDRNRTDSLLLLRIQNGLNSLGLAMRDMLDSEETYSLIAWRPQFKRLRTDLDDALAKNQTYLLDGRSPDQQRYLNDSFAQFWDSLDRMFALAVSGQEPEARTQIRLSLQARQAALTSAVARLLVQNNERDEQAAFRTRDIYAGEERNAYIFVAAMLVVIALTSLYVVQYNRRIFDRVAELSKRRSELAQQLISIQENTFRSISRELHDEFGQILTAIGAMLRRADRQALKEGSPLLEQLGEVREIVQTTLDKVRSLSHALHPVILDEVGLESALDVYIPTFQKQTGIEVRYEKSGIVRSLDRNVSIQLYRVMQEALNNVTKHSKSVSALVKLQFHSDEVVLEVEDSGVGFGMKDKQGMGLVSMSERAELVNGRVEFLSGQNGGALVRVSVPTAILEETNA